MSLSTAHDTIGLMREHNRIVLREGEPICARLTSGEQIWVLQSGCPASEFFIADDNAIRMYAEVVDDVCVNDPSRFPGAWVGAHVLVLRIHPLQTRLPAPVQKGPWIELAQELPVDRDRPVYNRTEFRKRLEGIQELLGD